MQSEFWAKRRRDVVGPFPTRAAALAAFIAAHPFMGEAYEARAPRNQIMTGYGNGGPYFDLRWHDANATTEG